MLLGLLCGVVVLAAQTLTRFVEVEAASSSRCSIPLTNITPPPHSYFGMPLARPDPAVRHEIREADPPAPPCDESNAAFATATIERMTMEPPLRQTNKFLIPKLGPLIVPPQK